MALVASEKPQNWPDAAAVTRGGRRVAKTWFIERPLAWVHIRWCLTQGTRLSRSAPPPPADQASGTHITTRPLYIWCLEKSQAARQAVRRALQTQVSQAPHPHSVSLSRNEPKSPEESQTDSRLRSVPCRALLSPPSPKQGFPTQIRL